MTPTQFYNLTRVTETSHWTLEMVLAFTKDYYDFEASNKKYTEEDIISIVNKSRETGLTAEYLILQLNNHKNFVPGVGKETLDKLFDLHDDDDFIDGDDDIWWEKHYQD